MTQLAQLFLPTLPRKISWLISDHLEAKSEIDVDETQHHSRHNNYLQRRSFFTVIPTSAVRGGNATGKIECFSSLSTVFVACTEPIQYRLGINNACCDNESTHRIPAARRSQRAERRGVASCNLQVHFVAPISFLAKINGVIPCANICSDNLERR